MRQQLTNSTRNIIDRPNIIPSKINYSYESFINTPKMILVIENKQISKNLLNALALQDNSVISTIDYNEKDPNKTNNIFNYFNHYHSNLIKESDSVMHGKYENSFYTNNYNFAYHYFIDKKGNIYEGRPHNLRAYNLDIFTEPANKENTEYMPLLNQGNLIFNDCLVILTEEATDSIDTTNAVYSSLKSLLIYLRQQYNYKKFYCYSELKGFKFVNVEKEEDDKTRYNNPGIFFKINELHSAVENKSLVTWKEESKTNIKIFTYGGRVLKYNIASKMSGNDVIMLQKMLYKLELLPKYKNITGIYDITTQQAISSLQKKYYITPELGYGIADKNTLKTIRDKIYLQKLNNIKIIDDNYSPFRILEYNENNPMMGEDVLILQTKLRRIIYPSLKINGIYDEYTLDAVKMFQSKYSGYVDGEMLDGKIGPETWNLILNCNDYIFVLESDSDIEGSITPTKCTVGKTNMVYLQKAINEMLIPYGTSIELTGGYDEATQKYIKLINENENNRKIIGLDMYRDKLGKPLDWTNDFVLRTCYPAEFIYLLKHYLLKETIELQIIY